MATAFVWSMSLIFIACNSGNEVQIDNPFAAEGNYELEIIRTKDDYQGNRRGDYNTITKVNLVVKSINGNTANAELQYGATTVEGNRAAEITPDQLQMINVWEGLTIPLTIEDGVIALDDYMKAFSDVEQRFKTIYGFDTVAQESQMYQQFKQRFRELAKDEESILNNFIPEIPLFFGTVNKTYINNNVSSNDSIQSPYGEGYLKLVSQVSIFSEEDFTEVIERDTINEADIVDARNNMIQQYAGNPQMDPQQLQNIPLVQYVAEKSIILSSDGKLESIEEVKTFDNGMQKQSDIVKVKFNSGM
jgi:hypothetical protein